MLSLTPPSAGKVKWSRAGWVRRCAMPLAMGIIAGCVPAHGPGQFGSQVESAMSGAMGLAVAPHLQDDRMIAADGASLPLRHWLPTGQPQAIVLALHGFNDYSKAFAGVGPAWARGGIATFAYDQRGFGTAPGRGGWAGVPQLTGDVGIAVALLHQRYPGVPLFLLGESMGGAVAILSAAGRGGSSPSPVDGVILVAPAVWGRQTMGFLERTGLWLAALMPALSVSADVLPVTRWPSDNMAMLREFNADPLVIKATRAEALTGLVDLMSAALNAAPWFTVPSLILYGAHDEVIPAAPVARFVEGLPSDAYETMS